MELWKTMDGYDGTFSISNTKKIHRAEYLTESDCRGVKVQARVPEETFSNMKEITTQYKNEKVYFNFFNEERNYFTAEELKEGLEIVKAEMEKSFKVEEKPIETPNEPVESLPNEIWKDIPNHRYYQVSDEGRFKILEHTSGKGTLYPEKLIFAYKKEGSKGLFIRLWNDEKRDFDEKLAAKVVAEVFLPNPKKLYIVHHIDGNPFNIKLENLKWYDDTPSNYYECIETKEIYKSLVDVCRNHHISRVKLKEHLDEGTPIKTGVTIVERKNTLYSSSGYTPSSEIKVIEKALPVETKQIIKEKNMSNPAKVYKHSKPKLLTGLKNMTTAFISNTLKKPLVSESGIKPEPNESWIEIKDFPKYSVSNKGRIKRNVDFDGKGGKTSEYLEKLYEKPDVPNMLFVKLSNSYGVYEKSVERLVASHFVLNPKDYYLLGHLDGNYKNNRSFNLRWVPSNDLCLLECKENKEEQMIETVAKVLDLSLQETYTAALEERTIKDFTFRLKAVSEPASEVKPLKEQTPEEWRDIALFDDYEVSDKGNVRNKKTGVVLTPDYLGNGQLLYPYVKLFNAKHDMLIRVDRLVARAFMKNKNFDTELSHRNGNLLDCSLKNLKFYTPSKYTAYVIMPYEIIVLGKSQAALVTGLKETEIADAIANKKTLYGYKFISMHNYKGMSIVKDIEDKYMEKEVKKVKPVVDDLYKEIRTSKDWYTCCVSNKGKTEYFCSKKGEVVKFDKGRKVKLAISVSSTGVKSVNLGGLGAFTIGKLVATKWLPNPDKLRYAKHKNSPSDDSVENLFWTNNPRETWEQYQIRTGLIEEPKTIETYYDKIKQSPDWKQAYPDIKEINGEYFVNKAGEVKHFVDKEEQKVTLSDIEGGYRITLSGYKVISVARLVALLWLPNPYNYGYVRHKGDIYCDNVENLFWTSFPRDTWENFMMKQKNATSSDAKDYYNLTFEEVVNSPEWKETLTDDYYTRNNSRYFIAKDSTLLWFDDKNHVNRSKELIYREKTRKVYIPFIGRDINLARLVAEAFVENTEGTNTVMFKKDYADRFKMLHADNLYWKPSYKYERKKTKVELDNAVTIEELEQSPDWKRALADKNTGGYKYYVSKKGEIKKFDPNNQEVKIKVVIDKNRGQYVFNVYPLIGKRIVAHEVATAFIENPHGYRYARHKGDILDDSVENLFWTKNNKDVWKDDIVEEIKEIEKVAKEIQELDVVKALGDLIPKAPKIGSDDMKLELTTIYQAAKRQKEQGHYLSDDEYANYLDLKEYFKKAENIKEIAERIKSRGL